MATNPIDYAALAEQARREIGGAPLPGPPKPPLPPGLMTPAQETAAGPMLRSRTGALYQSPAIGTMPVIDTTLQGPGKIAAGVEQLAAPAEALATDLGVRQAQVRAQQATQRPVVGPAPPEQFTPEMGRQAAAGANQIIGGAMDTATPLLVGGGVTAPVRTALGVAEFAGVSAATQKALEKAGVAPEYRELAGQIVGAAAAGYGTKLANDAMPWLNDHIKLGGTFPTAPRFAEMSDQELSAHYDFIKRTKPKNADWQLGQMQQEVLNRTIARQPKMLDAVEAANEAAKTPAPAAGTLKSNEPAANVQPEPAAVPEPTGTGTGAGAGGEQLPAAAPVLSKRPTPAPVAADLLNDFAAKRDLPPVEHAYEPVDQPFARKVADAYDQLPVDDSKNPAVVKSYNALTDEIKQQWDHAVEGGLKFEPWEKEGQPYATSQEMVDDVKNNHHLYFFTGGDEHPFLSQVDPETGYSYNDMFRAIHDLYGHAAGGFGFGPRGEEGAWRSHVQTFSPEAAKAMTTETRGQNSWVNFGRQNYDENGNYRNIPASDRPFATQKVALLPDEFTAASPAGKEVIQQTPAVSERAAAVEESPALAASRAPERELQHLPDVQRNARYYTKAHFGNHANAAAVQPMEIPERFQPHVNGLLLNPSAMELIGRAAQLPTDYMGTSVGLQVAPTDAAWIARNLDGLVRTYFTKAPPEAVTQLKSALETAAKEGKSLVAVSDAPDFEHLRDSALAEELNHSIQGKLTGTVRTHLGNGVASFMDHPAYRKAADALVNIGYPKPIDPAEIGVRLMHPEVYKDLGLNADEARSLAAQYIRSLREEYGSKPPREIAAEVFASAPERTGEARPSTGSVRQERRAGSPGGSEQPIPASRPKAKPDQAGTPGDNSTAGEDEDGAVPAAEGEHVFERAAEGQRGERRQGDSARVSKEEKQMIAESASSLSGKEKRERMAALEDQLRQTKRNFPTKGQFPFEPMEVRKIDPTSARPFSAIEYKAIPYRYAAPVDGEKLWKGTSLTPKGNQVADKLADLIVKDANEIRKAGAEARDKDLAARTPEENTAVRIDSQRDWYNRMRGLLRRSFGSAGDLFADLLGATSAQTPVRINWQQAVEAIERASKGHYSDVLPGYKQYRESGGNAKDYKGPRALRYGDKNFNANTTAVMDALSGLWRGKPGAPKTQNYAGNLIGTSDEATIDVWMARMLQRLRNELYGDAPAIPPPAEKGVEGTVTPDGTTGEFMFGQRVLERAAKKLGMKPHELQAFTWFAEKDLWTKLGLTSGIGEGGDMAANARNEDLGRMLAGIAPKNSGDPTAAMEMMKPVAEEAKKSMDVKAVVNSHGLGVWNAPAGDKVDDPEYSSNFEVTFKRQAPPQVINRIAAGVFKAAKKNGQDDAFVARTVRDNEESDVHLRPSVSVYFNKPLEEKEALAIIRGLKTDNIGGFTLFGGPELKPGQYRGMRFVYMPEYVHEPANIAAMSDKEVDKLVSAGRDRAMQDMRDILKKTNDDSRIGSALIELLDVLNGSKENYDDLIAQLEGNGQGAKGAVSGAAGGGGAWRQPIGQSVKERAVRKTGGEQERPAVAAHRPSSASVSPGPSEKPPAQEVAAPRGRKP